MRERAASGFHRVLTRCARAPAGASRVRAFAARRYANATVRARWRLSPILSRISSPVKTGGRSWHRCVGNGSRRGLPGFHGPVYPPPLWIRAAFTCCAQHTRPAHMRQPPEPVQAGGICVLLHPFGRRGRGSGHSENGYQNAEASYCLEFASHCCNSGPPRLYAVASSTASQSKSAKLCGVSGA